MFKVNNKDARTMPGIFIVNSEHISHLVLVFLLLTLNINCRLGLMPVFLFVFSFFPVFPAEQLKTLT